MKYLRFQLTQHTHTHSHQAIMKKKLLESTYQKSKEKRKKGQKKRAQTHKRWFWQKEIV